MFQIKFAFDVVSEMFKYYGNIHVYCKIGQGHHRVMTYTSKFLSYQCCMRCFDEIGPPVLVLLYHSTAVYGHGGHLGHVT